MTTVNEARLLLDQLFRAIDPDGLPCPRCLSIELRWLNNQLGAACERCLEQMIDDVLSDPEVELSLDPTEFLCAIRDRVVDLYCLFTLSDKQKGS